MNRLLLLLIICISFAFARLNPFEPVSSPNIAIPSDTLEPIPVDGKIMSADDGNRTVKIMSDEPKKAVEPKVIVKEKIIEKIIVKDINTTTISKGGMIENEIPKKVEVKKPTLIEKCYKVLPFLTIDLQKNKLDIDARDKYKIIKVYTIPIQNKIVIDFAGAVKHYTKSGTFTSPLFKSYKVGNHPEKGFFRVVITTKHNPEKYMPLINKNKVTISYK
jgi:hypothetical protein